MRIFSDIGLGDRFMNNAHIKGNPSENVDVEKGVLFQNWVLVILGLVSETFPSGSKLERRNGVSNDNSVSNGH